MLFTQDADRPRSPLFFWRTSKKLTQYEAAALLGTQQPQYERIENAKALPKLPMLRTLDEVIGAGTAAQVVMHHFQISREEADCYFRKLTAQTELS